LAELRRRIELFYLDHRAQHTKHAGSQDHGDDDRPENRVPKASPEPTPRSTPRSLAIDPTETLGTDISGIVDLSAALRAERQIR
jgi:hypothetical protein